MPRHKSKNPKNKIIQIRVSEDTFNTFEHTCYEKHDKSISAIGLKLIQNFLNNEANDYKTKLTFLKSLFENDKIKVYRNKLTEEERIQLGKI